MRHPLAAAALLAGLGAMVLPPAARAETVADAIKAAQDKKDADDDEGAYQIYSQIIQQFPNEFPEVYVYRADLEAEHGLEKEEVADLTKALAIDEASKDPVLDRGEVYEDLGEAKSDIGDEKGAILAFTTALKFDPKNEFIFSKRADAKFYAGDCAGAAADYSQAIALKDEPEVLFYIGRGMAHICLGDLANATADYRVAAAQTQKEIAGGESRGLTEWDLTGWAVLVRFGSREEADKMLTLRLSQDTVSSGVDIEHDAALVYLGKADLPVLVADAAVIKAKSEDKSDSWDSAAYYDSGLKEMVDGHDAAALVDFQKVLATHDSFINLRPLSRAWIADIRRRSAGPKPAAKGKAP